MQYKEPYTTLDDLLKILPKEYTYNDRQMIIRAYHVAAKAHEGQTRRSGEPYITHCIAVASILAEELRVPATVIVAALLHDTVEDTDLTLEDIESAFSKEIAKLVDGVTKMKQLPRVSQESAAQPPIDQQDLSKRERQRKEMLAAATLRKTLLTMNDDIRVVLIKLADRLHNMRTLYHMPEHKQKRIARQTMDIFAPLANRLGIWQLKWQLEDLSFRYLEPEKYKEIATQLEINREAREKEIEKIIEKTRAILQKAGVEAEIYGRPKHIYSIYRKMQRKDKPFDMVRDIRGIRLIVPDAAACYTCLGLIHTTWRPIPGEFDDYIANPKDNFYRSLHTAVIYEDGKPLEVQIRTIEMHQDAEYGIAAHWRYKEGDTTEVLSKRFQERLTWLRRAMEWQNEVTDANEFVDVMRREVFAHHIYTFTPNGDAIDLPVGATPIDFAYHVHTEIGHRCRGARVNGKLVSLDTPLKNGDMVEILTSNKGGPSRDWLNADLNLVKTTRARSKIKQYLRKQDRAKNIAEGRELLETELERLGLEVEDFNEIAAYFNYNAADNLFAAIGTGDIRIGKVINYISSIQPEQELVLPPDVDESTRQTHTDIRIIGLPQNTIAELAHCCNPVYGDPIIGLVTRTRGVRIHRQDCPNILRVVERDRLLRIEWGNPRRTYPVPILITAYDRLSLVSDILKVIDKEHINMTNMDIKTKKWSAQIYLTVEVQSIEQLGRILGQISNIPNVRQVRRIKSR